METTEKRFAKCLQWFAEMNRTVLSSVHVGANVYLVLVRNKEWNISEIIDFRQKASTFLSLEVCFSVEKETYHDLAKMYDQT